MGGVSCADILSPLLDPIPSNGSCTHTPAIYLEELQVDYIPCSEGIIVPLSRKDLSNYTISPPPKDPAVSILALLHRWGRKTDRIDSHLMLLYSGSLILWITVCWTLNRGVRPTSRGNCLVLKRPFKVLKRNFCFLGFFWKWTTKWFSKASQRPLCPQNRTTSITSIELHGSWNLFNSCSMGFLIHKGSSNRTHG